MNLEQILAIIGGIIGLVIVLATIFDWPIIPVPSGRPSVGTPAGHLSKAMRLRVGIGGALLVVVAILKIT
jgi:hypothetical protein